MKPKQITWVEANYGFEYAFVGKIKIGSVGPNTHKSRGSNDPNYVLSINLPGIKESLECTSYEHGKELMEKCLKRSIELLTEL